MVDSFDVESMKAGIQEAILLYEKNRGHPDPIVEQLGDALRKLARLTAPTDHAGLVADAAEMERDRDALADELAVVKAELAAALQAPVPAEVEDQAKQLRARKKRGLPADWQKGRKCPECDSVADRPKCMWDMGPSCPRHDPDAYDPPAWEEVPDKDCQAAANLLERQARTNEALTREHAARLAKVRAEIAAKEASVSKAGVAHGLQLALAIIDAEFPPAGQGERSNV